MPWAVYEGSPDQADDFDSHRSVASAAIARQGDTPAIAFLVHASKPAANKRDKSLCREYGSSLLTLDRTDWTQGSPGWGPSGPCLPWGILAGPLRPLRGHRSLCPHGGSRDHVQGGHHQLGETQHGTDRADGASILAFNQHKRMDCLVCAANETRPMDRIGGFSSLDSQTSGPVMLLQTHSALADPTCSSRRVFLQTYAGLADPCWSCGPVLVLQTRAGFADLCWSCGPVLVLQARPTLAGHADSPTFETHTRFLAAYGGPTCWPDGVLSAESLSLVPCLVQLDHVNQFTDLDSGVVSYRRARQAVCPGHESLLQLRLLFIYYPLLFRSSSLICYLSLSLSPFVFPQLLLPC